MERLGTRLGTDNAVGHAHPHSSITMPNGLDLYKESKSVEGLVDGSLVQCPIGTLYK